MGKRRPLLFPKKQTKQPIATMQEKHICHPNPIWGLCRKPLALLQPVASPTPTFRNACPRQQKTREPNQRSLQGQMLPSSVLVSVPHLPFSCPGPPAFGMQGHGSQSSAHSRGSTSLTTGTSCQPAGADEECQSNLFFSFLPPEWFLLSDFLN